jgi:hypothetical protein
VCGLLDLVGEGDVEVGARDVSVPVGVSDKDVGAEAEGTGLRPRVVRAEAKGRTHVELIDGGVGGPRRCLSPITPAGGFPLTC